MCPYLLTKLILNDERLKQQLEHCSLCMAYLNTSLFLALEGSCCGALEEREGGSQIGVVIRMNDHLVNDATISMNLNSPFR